MTLIFRKTSSGGVSTVIDTLRSEKAFPTEKRSLRSSSSKARACALLAVELKWAVKTSTYFMKQARNFGQQKL